MSEISEQTNNAVERVPESKIRPEDIHLPPNSYWPIILAFGFTCIVGGLALSIAMTLVGVAVTLVATIGWVIEPVHAEDGH
jgi:hypothetical protein